MTATFSKNPRRSSPKPRVLVVGPFPPAIGGMVSVIQSIVNSRLSESFDFLAFPITSAGSEAESLLRRIVRHVRRWLDLVRTLRRGRVDVLYLHTCSGVTFYRQMMDFAAATTCGVGTVWHIHGAGFDRFLGGLRGLRRSAVRRALQHADRVIVLGWYWKNVVEAFAPAARTAIVANAVEAVHWPDLRSHRRRCLFIGDLSERKGIDDLLVAASTGLASMELRIIGTGSAQRTRQLRDRIDASGARHRVQLLGALTPPQVRQELCNASVFLLPSYAEGLPMAMLEAMSCGLPVVVSDVGAIPEVVRDGREGFLIRPGDRQALVDRCRRLMLDDNLRNRMGRNARARVRELFSLDRMVDALHPLLADLVSAPNRGLS